MDPFTPLVQSLRKAHSIDTNGTLKNQLFQLNDVATLVKEQLLLLDEQSFNEGFLTFGFITGKTTKHSRERAVYDLAHLRAVLQEIDWKLPLLNAHRGTPHEERARRMLCDLIIKLQNQHRQFSHYARKGSPEDSMTLLTRLGRWARTLLVPDWTGWELEKNY